MVLKTGWAWPGRGDNSVSKELRAQGLCPAIHEETQGMDESKLVKGELNFFSRLSTVA